MTWAEIKTRLRIYLRDPDGDIWSDADLLAHFNDAQFEIASKTGAIVQVSGCYWPPDYRYSYLFDWEKESLSGDRYQALAMIQPLNMVGCYPWEAGRKLSTSSTGDSGYRMTHPCEVQYGLSADAMPIPLHEQFKVMRFAAWDGEQMLPTSEWELARLDSNYRQTIGDSSNYYHVSGESNLIVPYPQPSVVWDDTVITDVMDDTGGIVAYDESWLDTGNYGVTYDVIPIDSAYFFVMECWPQEITADTDEPEFAPYCIKYVEAATLERCYSADTDGFIPTLRDFWKMRKDVGIAAIKKWQRLGLINRQYRLGGNIRQTIGGRYPRLPSTYDDRY